VQKAPRAAGRQLGGSLAQHASSSAVGKNTATANEQMTRGIDESLPESIVGLADDANGDCQSDEAISAEAKGEAAFPVNESWRHGGASKITNSAARGPTVMSHAFPILAMAGIAATFSEVHDDALWEARKKMAFNFLKEQIKEIDLQFPNDPRERKERQRLLSREHHLLYVMDRLRRKVGKVEGATASDLTRAAQYILDRNLYPVAQRTPFVTQAIENRRALVAARVHWHKMMRGAGAKPPGREGGWSEPERRLRGSAKLFRALDKPGIGATERDELLRTYIEDRLAHLVAVSRAVTGLDRRELKQRTRLLLQEIEIALKRAKRCA
jgi:hypothetical protein